MHARYDTNCLCQLCGDDCSWGQSFENGRALVNTFQIRTRRHFVSFSSPSVLSMPGHNETHLLCMLMCRLHSAKTQANYFLPLRLFSLSLSPFAEVAQLQITFVLLFFNSLLLLLLDSLWCDVAYLYAVRSTLQNYEQERKIDLAHRCRRLVVYRS